MTVKLVALVHGGGADVMVVVVEQDARDDAHPLGSGYPFEDGGEAFAARFLRLQDGAHELEVHDVQAVLDGH